MVITEWTNIQGKLNYRNAHNAVWNTIRISKIETKWNKNRTEQEKSLITPNHSSLRHEPPATPSNTGKQYPLKNSSSKAGSQSLFRTRKKMEEIRSSSAMLCNLWSSHRNLRNILCNVQNQQPCMKEFFGHS